MSSERLDWQRLLEEALTVEGSIPGVYGRFHDYSLANVTFFHAQDIHEPVASFSRWKALGRHIVRGVRAK